VPKRARQREYSEEFKAAAVEKMRSCDNVVQLARELRVGWRSLYHWKKAAATEAAAQEENRSAKREAELNAEIARLKTVLAEKTLEVDFFRGALQKIETLRGGKGGRGGGAFTTRSGK
jgi:transposase-like protein